MTFYWSEGFNLVENSNNISEILILKMTSANSYCFPAPPHEMFILVNIILLARTKEPNYFAIFESIGVY